jgi:probable phosphoglycerate mutase
VELYVLTRHGESTLNSENRINGDPGVPVALTEKGREEARLLGQQVAHLRLDLCICTRFTRTRETAEIALQGRDVPIEVEPLLDDIDVGDLEGIPLEDYRAWKREHTRRDPFPAGESLDAAAERYAQAFRKLLQRPQTSMLVVTHEIRCATPSTPPTAQTTPTRPPTSCPTRRPTSSTRKRSTGLGASSASPEASRDRSSEPALCRAGGFVSKLRADQRQTASRSRGVLTRSDGEGSRMNLIERIDEARARWNVLDHPFISAGSAAT